MPSVRAMKSGKEFNLRVGILLKKYRLSLGLTGSELGKLLHVSQQQVSRNERGVTALSVFQLHYYLMVLDIPWDKFVSELMQVDKSFY